MKREIDSAFRRSIQERLTWIEGKYGVRNIYAVESGSRAWGFESVDSGYDIGIIHCHQANWYVIVYPERDVIELPPKGLDDYLSCFSTNMVEPFAMWYLNSWPKKKRKGAWRTASHRGPQHLPRR